ncbi:MAG TPA: hypothetical protein VH417_09330 [Vicinamibacterales bacterium]
MTAVPAKKGPAQLLPLLYLGAAHVALMAACAFAALWPRSVAGFFYHSWLIGLVHLVTLGWITFSILGAIFIVGPLALRIEMPARRGDYVAYAVAVIGVIGMVGHFWIEEYAGMAWSAGTVAAGVIYTTIRIVRAVRRAHIQPAVRLHIVLACANFWIAASMGLLVAIDKAAPFLPGFVLSNVFAHAHLAAIGWATLMVVGVGYRLLPMTFPSKMPTGRSIYATAVLLEGGVLGLFVSLMVGSSWALFSGALIVAGVVVFAAHVAWMIRRRVPKPVGLPRIQFGLLHAASAGLCLAAAAAIGLALLVLPRSPATLRAAAAYGVLGLLGFLAQMVVAMEARLLPMVAWFWSYARNGYRVPPPSPHVVRDRSLQAIVFIAWTIGVPALAGGMAFESAPLVALGASALFVGVAVGGLDNALVVGQAAAGAEAPALPRVARRRRPPLGHPAAL